MAYKVKLGPLQRVQRRDHQLWLFAIFMTMATLGVFLVTEAPLRLTPFLPPWVMNPDLERYLNAFTLLVMVFCFYALYTQRQLRALREELWRGEVERETLNRNLELTHSLFLGSASSRSTEELQRTLPAVAEAACQAMGARQVVMYLDSNETAEESQEPQRLVMAGSVEAAPAAEAEAVRAVLESGPSERLEAGGRHGLVMPLEHGGDRLGALVAWCEEPVSPLGERLASIFANNAAAATAIARLRAAQQQQMAVLRGVNTVSRAVASSLGLRTTLERVLDETLAVLDAEAGSILLRNAEGQLEFSVVRGPAAETLTGMTLCPGQGVAGHVFQTRQARRTGPAAQERHFDSSFDARTRFSTRSLLAAPLCVSGEALGVLEVLNKRGGKSFTEFDLVVLEAIANQAAVSIDHARLVERIMRAKREWEITLDAIPECILMHQPDGRISRINAAAARLLGATPQELAGKPIGAWQPPDGRTSESCLFCEISSPGGPPAELSVGRPERTYLAGSVLLGDCCPGGGVVHVLTDITERKELQRQLVAQERLAAVGLLVSGVAHELNNPLTSVIGYAEVAQEEAQDPGLRRDLAIIRREAERVAKIVRDLLAFARGQKTEDQAVDVHQVIRGALDLRQGALRRAVIEVGLELGAPWPIVSGDSEKLRQAVLNLLRNAEQELCSLPPPRRIEVRSRAEAGRLHITVADNGRGIDPDVLPHLFEPFLTTKAPDQGRGLGLSVSYGIIRQHGGEIRAGWNHPRGARFEITLPLLFAGQDGEEPAPQQKSKKAEPHSAPLRILVVDDEEAVRGFIETVLAREGHRVQVTGDGQAALQLLNRETFDVVLCDYSMPGISGRAVYESLSKTAGRPEFIFVTGDAENDQTKDFLEKAHLPCLSKPFSAEELLVLLRGVRSPEEARSVA